MANKRFSEEGDGKASLSGKVSGKVEKSGADFKPLSHPKEGKGDEESFGGFGEVKVDVSMPGDPKGLKKA